MTPSLEPLHVKWFEERRGIRKGTLESFGVYSEDGLVVLPYAHAEKLRANLLEGDRRTWWRPPGADRSMFGCEPSVGATVAFIVEGETDTMRLAQALQDGDKQADVFGMSGMNWWLPEFRELFNDYSDVYVVFDDDKFGAPYPDSEEVTKKVRQANKTWLDIRKDIGPRARRVYLDGQAGDICEFFETFHVKGTNAALDRFRQLCLTSSAPQLNYPTLKLDGPLRQYDWLVDCWFAMGDVVLLFGEPGAGKSWLSMSLAVALANGETQWLDRTLSHHGPVMYIDQENPEDVVFNRMKQLGLTPEGAENMSVVWSQGIRIPRDTDKVIEDARMIDAKLIVFDSLTTAHNAHENDSGEMSDVFRNGFTRIGRETGAVVLVLHHAVKGEALGSFQRVRGSSAIPAMADFGLDCRYRDTDKFVQLLPYKPRRKQGSALVKLRIADVPNGTVVEAVPDTGPGM